jgi:erythromycin esterase
MRRYGDEIAGLSAPLTEPGDLDVLLERIGDARVVMIGEASRGTHEYYAWRAALTRRLITENGFTFVAVEGDWPDCERVDRSVRAEPDAPADPRDALVSFDRWPTWMWANEEVTDFCRWLRRHNLAAERPVSFHGLDVYSLWESLRAVLTYLYEHSPEVVAGAERYYRAMLGGARRSWNVRDTHMADTLDRLLAHHGGNGGGKGGGKGVVWAHNTHVGDARATSMAASGEVNIGQLARERHGADQVVLVGFGGHRGTVVAGDAWGAPMETMPVPPARDGSLEAVLHHDAPSRALFVWPPARPSLLTDELAHRAIGVVYHPERERWGNYVPTVLGDRYDAFLWFDDTSALRPLALLGRTSS